MDNQNQKNSGKAFDINHIESLVGYKGEEQDSTAVGPDDLGLDAADVEQANKRPLQKQPLARLGAGLTISAAAAGVMALGLAAMFSQPNTTNAQAVAKAATEGQLDPDALEEDRLRAETALGVQKQQAQLIFAQQRGTRLQAAGLPPGASAPSPAAPAGASSALPPPKSLPAPPKAPPIQDLRVETVQRYAPPRGPLLLGPSQPLPEVVVAYSFGSRSGAGATQSPYTVRPASGSAQAVVQVNYEQEAPVLSGSVRKTVPVGSRAQGTVLTPAYFEQPRTGAPRGEVNSDETFLVALDEPLGPLPAGTQLVTQILGVSANGLARMQVLAYTNADGDQKTIPSGAILVRGANGYPLLARNAVDRGPETASQDTGQALWSAVNIAAGLANQPLTQSYSTGIGGSSATYAYPPPNYVAGALQGATNVLARNGDQRARRAEQELLQRPDLWQLDPGLKVQVVINKPMGAM